MKNNNWEERFDEKFIKTYKIWDYYNDEPNPTLKEEFLDFIRQERKDLLEEVREEVKDIKYPESMLSTIDNNNYNFYNQALQDAISIIETHL